MSLDQLIEKLVAEFKSDPRNKISIDEEILIASVKEEVGSEISNDTLREVITAYLGGELDEAQESIYDGAVYACGLAARHCFGENPDDDIDYELSWLEQDDGSFIVEVRPN